MNDDDMNDVFGKIIATAPKAQDVCRRKLRTSLWLRVIVAIVALPLLPIIGLVCMTAIVLWSVYGMIWHPEECRD